MAEQNPSPIGFEARCDFGTHEVRVGQLRDFFRTPFIPDDAELEFMSTTQSTIAIASWRAK